MSGTADLAYDPRTRRRPGASPVTLRVYAALVQHAAGDGLTVDEIEALIRDGFPTDSYRAYDRYLRRRRERRGHPQSRNEDDHEFGTEAFRFRARRWEIGRALVRMSAPQSRTACRHPDRADRWLPGDRAPKAQKAWEVRPQRTKPIVVPYDPAADRAYMERYHAETRAIANAKAALSKKRLNTAEAHGVIRDLLALVESRAGA